MSEAAASVEDQISAIWTEHFPELVFGRSDNLFSLVADSLQAVLILMVINRHFKISIPITVLLTTPFTVTELARLVELYRLGTFDEAAVRQLLDEVEGMSEQEVADQLGLAIVG